MNLTDQDILELTELCNAVVDGTLTDGQQARLTEWLGRSDAARRFYVQFLGLSASLHQYASEMQTEAADGAVSVRRPWWRRRFWPVVGSLAVAATLLIAWTLGLLPRADMEAVAEVEAEESVAQITGVKDCRSSGAAPVWRPGDHVRRGQRLELVSGFLELTFDCGAQVTLQGPAVCDVHSAWEATLEQGTLQANVPPEARGFRISSPTVDVLDLGTEFGLIAASGGATDVYVLKGQVEATPREPGSHEPRSILLREEQAHRFSRTGSARIADAKSKFARFARPADIERFAQPVGYVRWSFDEPDGRLVRAVHSGMKPASCDARLESVSEAALDGLRVPGRWHGALRLDGSAYAEANAPDAVAGTPRTVACWVRIAPDAMPAEAAAVLAWRMKTPRKADGWPVEIGWNTRPVQGTFGALRAECGRDCLVGTTPLRDGRWHHVAVVLVPHQHGHARLHVKLYVDGRLERAVVTRTAPHPHKHHRETIAMPNRDGIWLGRRLDAPPAAGSRFRGELDELLIADRALTPTEIMRLVQENQPELPTALSAPLRDSSDRPQVDPATPLEASSMGRSQL